MLFFEHSVTRPTTNMYQEDPLNPILPTVICGFKRYQFAEAKIIFQNRLNHIILCWDYWTVSVGGLGQEEKKNSWDTSKRGMFGKERKGVSLGVWGGLPGNMVNSDKSGLLPGHIILVNLGDWLPHLPLFCPPTHPPFPPPPCWAPVGLTVPVQTVSSSQLSNAVSGPCGQTLPHRGEQTICHRKLQTFVERLIMRNQGHSNNN